MSGNEVHRKGSTDYGHKEGPTKLFSGLQQYKREDGGSASQQRRESLKDQSAQPSGGLLANAWNRYDDIFCMMWTGGDLY